jgi:hypothetical protein
MHLEGGDAPELQGRCLKGRNCTRGDANVSTDSFDKLVAATPVFFGKRAAGAIKGLLISVWLTC